METKAATQIRILLERSDGYIVATASDEYGVIATAYNRDRAITIAKVKRKVAEVIDGVYEYDYVDLHEEE